MEKIALFEKVSKKQYELDSSYQYEDIMIPKRATEGSAGYDFYMPFEYTINPGEMVKIPTGIRCKINAGWVLQIFPRSSLGFKYHLTLVNTVGIIDSDYYEAENEGHIQIKIVNQGDKPLVLEKGKAFAQGVFLPYGITMDDDCEEKRVGGFGSTDKVKL